MVVDLTMGNDRSLHALMPAPPPPLAALMARFKVTSFDEFYAERIGLHTRLREHGVTVVTGVDSGMAPPKQHGNAWRAVAEMVEAGYHPLMHWPPRRRCLRGLRAGRRNRSVDAGLRRRHRGRQRRRLNRHCSTWQPAPGHHPRGVIQP